MREKTPQRTFRWSAPLFTDWSAQYINLFLPETRVGTALLLHIDGELHDFQYTGVESSRGAQIVLKLGFEAGEEKKLVFSDAEHYAGSLEKRELEFETNTPIGHGAACLEVGANFPFLRFGNQRMEGEIWGISAPLRSSLVCEGEGPLFTDYHLEYTDERDGVYRLTFRCFKHEDRIEVTETFSLEMGTEIRWRLNPEKGWTRILSWDDFHAEKEPTIEPIEAEQLDGLLCRLQMPVLTEYFIPNNRGWFAFFDDRQPSEGMLGILGLEGASWEEAPDGMPEIYAAEGKVEWRASLVSGRRKWLLVKAPLEVESSPERRFLFHRLHAEWNALRLDQALEDSRTLEAGKGSERRRSFFPEGEGLHPFVTKQIDAHPTLQNYRDTVLAKPLADCSIAETLFVAMIRTQPKVTEELKTKLFARFERWVRQFQGWRQGEFDYSKCVIGFSRMVRGILIAFDWLQSVDALSREERIRFEHYFVFAARRILDEGRWPHSRTWKHPNHPESVRDFYTYGGEHRPDRLVWTNSLPNFQSDPMCALIHLAVVLPEHPEAAEWLRVGREDIERQLDAYCGKSGAWAESINYALYTLSYFVITFHVLKKQYGINYFQDARVRGMVSWLCRFFGPYDKRFETYTWPAVGNSILPQIQAQYLLAYASGLDADDALRREIFGIYKRVEQKILLKEHYGTVLAVLAPQMPDEVPPLTQLTSETMDEVGVSMRHQHTFPKESYLFQKIGFAKDHYEGDETAFNWYAKGDPFCMDYGTYTPEATTGGAHNLVEIAEMDAPCRGYLADHLFTLNVDYTRCEVPVTQKLLWGHPRSFEEIDQIDGVIDRKKTPYFYIGDRNPVGPKIWKVRQMLYVKPDYLVLFDRVIGKASHRWNLHFTGGPVHRQGNQLWADGRFTLDLMVTFSHPLDFQLETGEMIPNAQKEEDRPKHAQHFCRVTNKTDGCYRALVFAKEKDREVTVTSAGKNGFKVEASTYTDYVFLSDEFIREHSAEFEFSGRAGWIRRHADGSIEAVMADGDLIGAFGKCLTGSGPWHLNRGNQCPTGEGSPPGREVVVKSRN
ncbi:hypothetical protein [Puniceicoccus vermicola]|uniref:Heparin-sulfate lyase N-terminal domain-containing protein n=1 Tax=Puniceicoccus vermicola TaxID=388746 RepID=A0A7X1AZT4_9BACT|nr:hypothetical protein [Puniceicoccus vermicola]MBC2602952.1 hypothetical protein [Puniceicoccus vermicola]